MAKKNTLVKNASILMTATIISRIIGLLYRRPLGRVLGSVGLGYYGYASNLYAILLLISSYSIPMAVSKIVSERLAKKQYKNASRVFKGALLYACLVGGITALICLFGGRWLLPQNQQNALPALRVLAPTIFLSAILGVFRGWFQAHKTMGPTSISQIAEQIMNAFISVLAAWLLIRALAPAGGLRAATFGAMGGTLGTGAGVLAGLLFMLFVYRVNAGYFKRRCRQDPSATEESYQEVFQTLFLMMTPIIFTSFIENASGYLDGYLYSAIQGWHGIESTAISAAYGEFSNYYTPIVGIPLALASAGTSAMMPEVSGLHAQHRMKEANAKVSQTIRLSMFLCMPCMFGMTILAYPIMGVLFPASTAIASRLLLTGSLYILFGALTVITASALQSIGRQKEAMINCGIALVINIVVLAGMLAMFKNLDIYAVMIANILFSLICCITNILSMKKYMGFRMEMRRSYVDPLIASAGMGFVTFVAYNGLYNLLRRRFTALLISIVVAILVYMILYVLVSGTTEEEMQHYPLGGRIVKLLRFLHVY